jgi:hypothetical protein
VRVKGPPNARIARGLKRPHGCVGQSIIRHTVHAKRVANFSPLKGVDTLMRISTGPNNGRFRYQPIAQPVNAPAIDPQRK